MSAMIRMSSGWTLRVSFSIFSNRLAERVPIVGGIYDDRFLVKPTKSALDLMPDVSRELPYEGAKEMLLVEDIDDRAFLNELLNAIVYELPAPKKKK